MKILFNIPTVQKSGVYPRTLSRVKTYIYLGAKVFFHCGNTIIPVHKIGEISKFNQNFQYFKKIPLIEQTRLSFMKDALKKNFLSLLNIKQLRQYDVIFSPSSVLDLIITPFIAKIFYPKIIWITVFDNIVPFTDPGNKLVRFTAWIFFQISLFLIRFADKIFVSTPELMLFLAQLNYPTTKLYQTKLAIENDLIRKAKIKQRYKTDALYVGRINETKGIYDLLNVVSIVAKTFPNFKLSIVGSGDKKTEKEYQNEVKKRQLSNNIKFWGYVAESEKYHIIKSSKIFIFLSRSGCESFGLALLEAVCTGLPAFTYDLPPYKTIYRHQEINKSPIGDYNLVANKILAAFKSKKFINSRGKKLLGIYSWKEIASKEYSQISISFQARQSP